ncbi:MAG: sigma-70 family RNA polymerase sigma factor [Clostridiales bacterium]|jgi:RNA polymerase sporulation-specific sigma factor|nr:sigma-70 family RNA polymerase sigma factor [Clostridiales bacterium]
MDYAKFSDEQLARLAADESAAQEALLRRFKGHVTKIARPYFIMGGDREDLVQEGMIGLYKAIREFRAGTASFATFATVCIKNQILDAIKNASRKKHGPLNTYISMDAQSPEIAQITDHHQEPEEILIHRENKLRLENLVQASLSDLESAILAQFLAGLSYAEIAETLGKTTKSVDNALFRIRRKVAKQLAV